MSFHVYPDPQTAALSLAGGATSAPIPIAQLTGDAVPLGSYNKMMFIRVATSGPGAATAPTISLQAGTGAAVPAGAFTAGVFRSADPADYVGDVQLVTLGEAAGVQQVRMGFDQDSAETWSIVIKNNAVGAKEFTWVVGSTVEETAQPWLSATPNALGYQSLVNETIEQGVQVANKGTGPLSLTSLTPALPAGFTTATPLPLLVAPTATSTLVVRFTAPAVPPAPDGKVTGIATLVATPADTTAGTSAGHNQQVTLTATTQQLEVVLLLDDSGSMSWDALGTPLPAGSPTSRWAELASATNQFLDLLAHFGNTRGRFGIARFPAGNPLDPATYDIVPMKAIPDLAGMASATAAVAAINPVGGTPMGDGLDRVLANATSYFGTDPLSVNADRRWLILMSDGAHNSGTHNPMEFIAPPVGTAPAGKSLAERKIDLFGVAYGVDGHTDVNHVLIKQLADGSAGGGQTRNVDDSGTTATELAQALRDTIKSGLTAATSPLDPTGVFVIGAGEVRHEVVLTRYDGRVAFALSWNTPDQSRLRLELITPNCEVITPENAGKGRFSQVAFRGGDRSHMYFIDPEFLDPGEEGDGHRGDDGGLVGGGGLADAAGRPDAAAEARSDDNGGLLGGGGLADAGGRHPGVRPAWTSPPSSRFGTWTFLITSPDVVVIPVQGGSPDLENYAYDVIVDSTLRLAVAQDAGAHFAGDPIDLSARLTADGVPVFGASVSASTTAPTESAANFLAGLRVPHEFLERAAKQLDGQDASPLLVKQVAAQLAGLDFAGGTRTGTIPLVDLDETGTYTATITDTQVPEQHTFYITAIGLTDDGIPFRREAKLETFVRVRPDPAHTRLDIRETRPDQTTVTIFPQDRFGNVVLIDPLTPGGFGITSKTGKVGPLHSNLDGTYTCTVDHDPKTTPDITLIFDGHPVIDPKPTLPLGKLHYPDRVLDFHLGAIQRANEHPDPEAALGTVVEKKDFVSLGAGGNLILAFRRQAVLATADDDITVFTHPDTDPRSYRLEAFSVEHARWVPLGGSIGVTESFSLRKARLKFTIALRLTDTSNRTRDDGFTPLRTPGVSILGLGARKTTSELPCRHDQLPKWYDW